MHTAAAPANARMEKKICKKICIIRKELYINILSP